MESTVGMVGEIQPEQLAHRLKAGEAVVLLDVREPWEVSIASLTGAIHIPLGTVPSGAEHLDPESEIIVFCHHGIRSRTPCPLPVGQGFKWLRNLTSGIDAWSVRIEPAIPRDA
jgi:rhodanese-related sulfurtransferase